MKNKTLQRELGQFFTPAPVAGLVAHCLNKNTGSVIDLAAGVGDLLKAVRDKAPETSISAVDIDHANIVEIAKAFPDAEIIHSDALNLDVDGELWLSRQQHDLVVGNPPYNKQKVSELTHAVINEELGVDCSHHQKIRAEIAFLALSLKAAKPSAYISLVLPKTIASGESWSWLRRILISRFRIESVTTLPASVFRNTEVETCILTLQKEKPTRKSKIKLIKCDENGTSLGVLDIESRNGIYRLDYDYHSWRIESWSESSETIGKIGVVVLRGNIYAKKAKELGINLFHTSDFSSIEKGVIHFHDQPSSCLGMVSVEKGDILIPRVGRNLEHRAMVGSGESIISDSVFGLKVPKGRLLQVRETLDSDHARTWIRIHTSGSCAKILSKNSLLSMPLIG